jgi:hypothetical protein
LYLIPLARFSHTAVASALLFAFTIFFPPPIKTGQPALMQTSIDPTEVHLLAIASCPPWRPDFTNCRLRKTRI